MARYEGALVLLAIIASAQGIRKEYLDKMNKLAELCVEGTDVQKDLLMKALQDSTVATTEQILCALDCYAEKVGYLKGKTLDWDMFKENNKLKFENPADWKFANEILDVCSKKVTVKEGCGTGKEVVKCVTNEGKNKGQPTLWDLR